jgi:TonB family protein
MRGLWVSALSVALAVGVGRAQQTPVPADAAIPASKLAAKKITPPRPLNSVEAEFSDEARAKGINGRCLISLTVDVAGMPQEISLVRCTDPSFARTSLAAVSKYRFEPARTQEGKPVEVKIGLEVPFERSDGRDSPGNPVHYGFITLPGTGSTGPEP